jgi:cysteine-rich repeat protein
VTPGLGLDYLPIIDRIQITGTGDGERDNNFYYLANPENGGVISSNINSYLPAYVIFAMDTQFVEIAGNVVDGGGLPISGVNLSADNGGGSATTDASGDYVLSVPYDWTGTVTASGTGLVFAPVSRSHTNLTVNISGDDYTGTPPPDLSPPDPDPMTFAIVPLATSSTSIWMTATTAVDQDSMPVAYAFECTNDASASSGWQSGAFYEASGLLPDTLYSFRVKARDSAAALNESSWSSTASATTPAPPAVCGNDVLETGEACDDGGTLDGDCCDASCQFEATDGPCDDADVCTTSDVCDGNGLCTPGTPLDCDDADVCTVDSCEPDLGCDYTPVQSPECSESHLVPSFSLPGHALLAALVLLAGGALLVRRPKELTR